MADEVKEFIAADDGRLDVILSELSGMSRSQASKAIRNGQVSILNRVINQASYQVKRGDRIRLAVLKAETSIRPPSSPIKIDYVYKDKYLAVINKPRGLVVHPAPGHHDDTLVNQLFDQDADFSFDISDTKDVRPGIVHRIDKDTSGLILIAEDPETQAELQTMMSRREIHRSYLALVYGTIKDKRFKIDAPLTRPNHTVRRALVDARGGREAITHCELLARGREVSLIRCELETGRTHQIRAHLAYISHPIVGDTLYGHEDSRFHLEGQCLHAHRLSFIHPVTHEPVICHAPLDDYFKKLLRYFFS